MDKDEMAERAELAAIYLRDGAPGRAVELLEEALSAAKAWRDERQKILAEITG